MMRLTGVLGGLALGVVEVGRDGDDCLSDGLAQVLLGVCLQLLEDACRDLLGGVFLAVDVDHVAAVLAVLDVVGDGAALRGGLGVVAADEALDGGDGVLRVGDGAVLSGLADDQLAVLLEGDDGRRGAVALCVDDDGGLAALEDGHCRVGGAQVDADNLAHDDHPFCDALTMVMTRDSAE